MKEIFFDERFNKKIGPRIWAGIHLALFVALAICFFAGRKFFVNTNLFDILPDSSSLKSVSKADKLLTEKSSRQFFILVKAKEFEGAKNAASLLVQEIKKSDSQEEKFESLSFEASDLSLQNILDYYYQNRFLLLDKNTIQKIESDVGIEELKEEAMQKAFGAFSLTPLEFLEGDPFFLADLELQNLIDALSKTGTSLAMRDGVLATEHDGFNYVMVRGALTQKGASITNKKNGVQTIYDCADKVAEECGQENVCFIYSGSPFHSYKSASSAQRQVAIISVLSLLAVIILLLFVFRSARPLLYSVGAITLSAAFGFAAELLAFGQIHILTFVFGTTLIGTCLDYSVHFWTRASLLDGEKDGAQVRNKIFKGLALSFASTEICYLTMLLAPFALLKQIGLFCFAGIFSAFLTSLLFYPKLSIQKKKINISKIKELNLNPKIKSVIALTMLIVFVALAIAFRKNLRLDNDLRKFYTMSGKLLEDEKLSAQVMNRKNGAWYYIVRAKSAEELLQTEEDFCALLQKEIDLSNLSSYSAVSQFVPSQKNKEASLQASQKLMAHADDLLELYGFEQNNFRSEIQKAKKTLDSSDSSFIPEHLQKELGTLWLGKIGSEYFSVILVSGGEAEHLKEIAQDFNKDGEQNVYFVNKMSDIAFELNRLTKIMLILLALAFAILIAGLAFFYKPKTLLKVAAVPLFVLLCEAAVIATFKIPLGFFSVTGIILVFGLGLDYIIYTVESGGDKANSLAVLLSFASTALSFGAIALSSFMPVHIFGTVVFAGLVAAWVSARIIK